MRAARELTLFLCLSLLGLASPSRTPAADSTESPLPQGLPQTVVVKSDMVFYVPFSVTRDAVSVRAGTEVLLKEVRGQYLKLAHGPAEMTVDAAATDFAERLARMQQVPAGPWPQTAPTQPAGAARAPQSLAAQITNLTPIPGQQHATPASTGDAQRTINKSTPDGGGPSLGFLILSAVIVAGAVGIAAFFIRRSIPDYRQSALPPPLPSAVRMELREPEKLSRFEIGEYLDALDWFQLEKLTAVLFEAKGTWVEIRGGAKADGGIDMVVSFNGATAAVQCKHWTKWHCGPAVVRELVGAMAIEKIPRGFLVCRSATNAAQTLALSNEITIVEREGLIDRIQEALRAENAKVRSALTQPKKLCPKCGAAMVLRSAGKGPNAGSQFWGCSTYPKCNQRMKV